MIPAIYIYVHAHTHIYIYTDIQVDLVLDEFSFRYSYDNCVTSGRVSPSDYSATYPWANHDTHPRANHKLEVRPIHLCASVDSALCGRGLCLTRQASFKKAAKRNNASTALPRG